MKIVNKQFILEITDSLSVDYIENFIKTSGYFPLRWSIVKAELNKFTVDAVLIIN